jgi:hypothetical protein
VARRDGLLVKAPNSSQGAHAQLGAAEWAGIGILAIPCSTAHKLLPAANVDNSLAFLADNDGWFLFQCRQTEVTLVFNTRHTGQMCSDNMWANKVWEVLTMNERYEIGLGYIGYTQVYLYHDQRDVLIRLKD